MKVTPIAVSGTSLNPAQMASPTSSAASAKAKAVAAFNSATPAPQAQETPVQNPNQVSVEELGAIQAKPATIANTETQEVTESIPAETPKDPEQLRRYSQLAKQERMLRAKAQQQEASLRAREEALKAREAELSAKPQFDPKDYISRARLQQDALGTLEAEGLADYDTITQRAVNRHPVDPQLKAAIEHLQTKIAQLEQANETNQKSYTQQQQQAYQSAVKQITRDAKDLVMNDPEYETIKATGSVRDVVDLITKQHAKDGTVLSVEDAAKEVEEYLIEEALKLTRVDKIKRRMSQANASPASSNQKTQAQAQTQGIKTLTNAVSSTRPMTTRERAIAAAEGRLKA